MEKRVLEQNRKAEQINAEEQNGKTANKITKLGEF